MDYIILQNHNIASILWRLKLTMITKAELYCWQSSNVLFRMIFKRLTLQYCSRVTFLKPVKRKTGNYSFVFTDLENRKSQSVGVLLEKRPSYWVLFCLSFLLNKAYWVFNLTIWTIAARKPMAMPTKSSIVKATVNGREIVATYKFISTDWKFKTEKIKAMIKMAKNTIMAKNFISELFYWIDCVNCLPV